MTPLLHRSWDITVPATTALTTLNPERCTRDRSTILRNSSPTTNTSIPNPSNHYLSDHQDRHAPTITSLQRQHVRQNLIAATEISPATAEPGIGYRHRC